MLNIHELEKKWFQYKLKSFIPYIASSFAVVVILVLIIIFYPSKEAVQNNEQPTVAQKQPTEVKKTAVVMPVKEPTVQVELNTTKQNDTNNDQKLVLKPSLNFVNEIGDSMVTYYDDKTVKPPVQKPKPVAKPAPKPVEKAAVKHTPKQVHQQPQSEITIKTRRVDNDLQEVIHRFKKTNNPVLSLFLAKKYYEMKKYNQSYNYALITNQLDNSIDMSWIIFAKSLVKLGQKDMAVNTLKSYIKNSNSQTAASLLDEIQSGRFQ